MSNQGLARTALGLLLMAVTTAWLVSYELAARPAGELKGETKAVVTSVTNVNNPKTQRCSQQVKVTVYSEYWEEAGVKTDIYTPGHRFATGTPQSLNPYANVADLTVNEEDPTDVTLHDGKVYVALFDNLVTGTRYSYEAIVQLLRVYKGGAAEVSYQSRPNTLRSDLETGPITDGTMDVQFPPAVQGYDLVWNANNPLVDISDWVGGQGTYSNPAAPATQGYTFLCTELLIAFRQGSDEYFFFSWDNVNVDVAFDVWATDLPVGETYDIGFYQFRHFQDGTKQNPGPMTFAFTNGLGLAIPGE